MDACDGNRVGAILSCHVIQLNKARYTAKVFMRISPHLCFDGRCREAMYLYHQILGGKIQTMLTYGETPMGRSLDPMSQGRIVHATLKLDDQELTGVDMLPGSYQRPQGFFITLTVNETSRAKAIFDALSAGGVIQVPFEKTFWSSGFGVLVDRFAIPWEINTDDGRPVA
jgi:PhnB protein